MNDETIYKRFMVFASDDYQSQHGLGDCYGHFDELKDAISFAEDRSWNDNVDIFDRIEGKIVWEK